MNETLKQRKDYMRKKFLDLSNKIDSKVLVILEAINITAKDLELDFFVVGATARDIIFMHAYGIPTGRATQDIDLGVNLKTWDQYHDFTKILCDKKNFSPTKTIHRFEYENYPVDIIPFGKIADKSKIIAMPPDQKVKMNLLGFEEAYADSITVRVRKNPILEVPIVSPLGFAILKIISWADRNEQSYKDAYDLKLVLKNYADLGNEERIFEVGKNLNQEDFDYETAGVILLGRDIVTIAKDKTLMRIMEILDNETGDAGQYRLIESMQNFNSIGDFKSDLKLLSKIKEALIIK